MSSEQRNLDSAIAIVGMAGRFPDAENLQAFWRNLEKGVESLVDFTDAELVAAGVPEQYLQVPNFVKRGSILKGADQFDASFFGFNPREAEILDPQQRIFLECAWEAIEDAGYGGESRPPVIGVYAGTSMNSYAMTSLFSNPDVMESAGFYQVMVASDKDFLASRVSYKLNLKGPSVTVQTACSTSLVAVQLASQALIAGHCDMALAGGVSVTFPQGTGYLYAEGMIFSPDGHIRPFDEQGRGIRGGNGAGIVVLKRLQNALRDGDNIHAVILGTAVNNDGSAKMGYSAPSVDGQSAVITAALRMSGINPATIGYVEAHGTGTPIGDPIEIAGLEQAYRAYTDKKRFCAIGALKSNIGHLDAAAGVAGIIKTVLTLQHKRIPPTLNFHNPNPAIDFEGGPFYVNDKLADWPSNDGPRRAAVSSFGIGGTNAHSILEEAPPTENSQVVWPAQLVVLSARSRAALDAMTSRLANHLESHPHTSLADACYTLQTGRTRFPHRRALVCSNVPEAISGLRGTSDQKCATAFEELATRPVTFMFSGQGSQYAGMARGLYETQPVFRKHLDFCATFLKQDIGCDLRTVIFAASADAELLNETRITQVALFAVEYSLAQMWMAWGVLPDTMIGHSIGEYVAACLAGVFSLEDALRIVAARGRIMQQMPAGNMLAVPLSAAEVSEFVDDTISLAAVNSPSFCTLSGPAPAISALEARLKSRGIACRILHTSHAFHSSMMDSAVTVFLEEIKRVTLRSPSKPFISNVTGKAITPQQATDPAYWAEQLRQPVYFAKGIGELSGSQGRIFLEVGPGQTLTTFTRDCTRGVTGCQVLPSLPHPKDSQSDVAFLLNTLGKLWLAGVSINWEEFHRDERLHRVSLPTYFFERQRYFIEPKVPQADLVAPVPAATRAELKDWFYVPSWQRGVFASVLAAGESHGPWLVFADDGPFSENIQNTLAARGERFVTVVRAAAFSRKSDTSYSIRPDSAADYVRLLGELRAGGLLPKSVLFLWSMAGGILDTARKGRLAFDALIRLAQAFGDSRIEDRCDWLVVTAGMQAVTAGESANPEQALVLGPVKVISREYPQIKCRVIDLPATFRSETEQQLFAESLADEPVIEAPQPVAYRNGFRWEQTFEAVRLPATPATHLRERGVYLITGGMGGVGFTLAEFLAKQSHARLVLTGRAKLPERSEWQNWIAAHGETNPVSTKIRQMERLESLGAEVLPISVDVSDLRAMQAALATAQARFGPINGVIHAAGIGKGGLIQLKTPEATDEVLAAKVQGTLILDSLLNKTPLDFFVLCSSIDAIAPVAGAVDYCAGNAFLDAFANAKWSGGRAVVSSINWDAWQEVGMAVSGEAASNMSELRRAYLQSAIRPDEGVAAFKRVLSAGLPQVAVVTHNLSRHITEIQNSASAPQSAAPVEERHSRPDLNSTFAPASTDVEKRITEIWAEVLGIGEIGIDDNFFEMGGHSLLATGVLSRVRDAFGVSVPLRTIFEAPTIRQLAKHVDTLAWIASDKSGASDEAGEREEVEL